jgi:hypothetical protein
MDVNFCFKLQKSASETLQTNSVPKTEPEAAISVIDCYEHIPIFP